MKAKLSNGNRFVSKYISVDRWFEVYADNGSYEGTDEVAVGSEVFHC